MYTVDQFAEQIKAKHPEYKDAPNDDLVNRIITKYPVYKSQVDMTNGAAGMKGTGLDTGSFYESLGDKNPLLPTSQKPQAPEISGPQSQNPQARQITPQEQAMGAAGYGAPTMAAEQAKPQMEAAGYGEKANEVGAPIGEAAKSLGKTAIAPLYIGKKLINSIPGTIELVKLYDKIDNGQATQQDIDRANELIGSVNTELKQGMDVVESVGRFAMPTSVVAQGAMGFTKKLAEEAGGPEGLTLGGTAKAVGAGLADAAMTAVFNKIFAAPKIKGVGTTKAKLAGLTDADINAATKGTVTPERGMEIIDAAAKATQEHGSTAALENVAEKSFLPTISKLEAQEAAIGKRIGEVTQAMRGKAVPQLDVAPVRDQLEQDLRALGVKFKGGKPVLTGSKIEGLGGDKLIQETWDFLSPKPLSTAAAGKAEIRTQLASDLKRLGVKFKGGEPIFEKPSYGDINGKISSTQLKKQWEVLPKPEGGTFKTMFDVYNKVGNLREKIFKGKANIELGQAERALANVRSGLKERIVNMRGEYGDLAKGYAQLDDFLTEISKATSEGVKSKEFLRKLFGNASSMSRDQLTRMEELAKQYGIKEGTNIFNEAKLAIAAENAAKYEPASSLQGVVGKGIPSKSGVINQVLEMGKEKAFGTPLDNLKRLLNMPQEQITPSRIESLLSNADPELKRGLMKYLNVKSAEQTALDRAPVSSVPRVKSAIPKELKPLTEKTSFNAGEIPQTIDRAKNLSPEYRAVETRAIEHVKNNESQILKDYKQKNGKVVNTDNFRPFFKDQGYNGSNSAAVQEPSSYLAKKAYAEGLKNDGEYVLATGGGSGAGKSSGLKNNELYKNLAEKSAVILDSNMSSLTTALKKIDQAREAGKKFVEFYVYREPSDAFLNGVIKRMKRNTDEMGRLVPSHVVAENHIDSFIVAKELEKRGIEVHYIDNSLGKGKAKSVTRSELEGKIKYRTKTELTKEFNSIAKKLYEKGLIKEAEYRGFIGE